MKTVLVYMTAGSQREAEKIGSRLVESRLAACVNYLGAIRSLYWWKDKMEKGREAAFIVKTRAGLLPRLIRKVKELHSYETPCIVAFPIAGGNPDFLRWIEQETRAAAGFSLKRAP